MGKPYESEISFLPQTFAWAVQANVDEYAHALATAIDHPLLVVGSGGSLTAAHLIAALHEKYTGLVAHALTPLDIVGTARRLDRAGVLFVSAGGSNPDIVDAFEIVARQEPHATLVLTGRKKSALVRATQKYRGAKLVSAAIPISKDGYLATNSLLAFSILTWRAYALATGEPSSVPSTFEALLGESFERYRANLAEVALPLWSRSSLVVLHGADTSAAGVDLESRFVEAALGNVNVADFRNFAHGRHQWLARYERDVAVITLEASRDHVLGRSTTALIPGSIPVVRLAVPGDGAHAAVASIVTVILLAAEAGKVRGIDPGRPKVPQFGRRMYRLRGLKSVVATTPNESARSNSGATRKWAAVRKSRVANAGVLNAIGQPSTSKINLGPTWTEFADQVALSLTTATYRGAVFDYDGTLCDEEDRYRGLSELVKERFLRLLARNIPIGIATGRGRSVHIALRKAVPARHWASVTIGYYNGADVRLLSASAPKSSDTIDDPALAAVWKALVADRRVQAKCVVTARTKQVTLELTSGSRESALWDIVSEIVAGATSTRLSVVRSSHSIDVLASGVTKLSVVRRVAALAGRGNVLCIGDRGRFPGNDHELLATPYGLSVDEVSGAFDQCWNLAPPGVTGVAATAFYLSLVRFGRASFRIFGI